MSSAVLSEKATASNKVKENTEAIIESGREIRNEVQRVQEKEHKNALLRAWLRILNSIAAG